MSLVYWCHLSIELTCFNILSLHTFSFSWMLFSILNLELYITDNALKVSASLYYFTTSLSHGVEIICPGCGVRASLMLFSYDALTIKKNLPDYVRSDSSLTFFRS